MAAASKNTIMVVDDEPDVLITTKKMLEHNGYSAHTFDSPIEAIEHIKDLGCRECTLVVSDVRMPDMSGFELVRHLKELRPEIKVILMTAFRIHKEEAQIVLPFTKVDAFLNKPFNMAELIEVVKECVKDEQPSA
jgi:DNA-binding NtrC family response regulator